MGDGDTLLYIYGRSFWDLAYKRGLKNLLSITNFFFFPTSPHVPSKEHHLHGARPSPDNRFG